MAVNWDDGPQVWGPKSGGTPVATRDPESKRILSSGDVVGHGTLELVYADDEGEEWMYERAEYRLDGINVTQALKDGFPEPASARETISRQAFNDFKILIDNIRAGEGADIFNWVTPINLLTVGSLTFRNELAAAYEFWSTQGYQRNLTKSSGAQASWSDACDECEDDVFTKGAEQQTGIITRLEGVKVGANYFCDLWRTSLKFTMDTDNLPTTPSRHVLVLRLGRGWSDAWARNNGMELWSATGSDWDDRDTLIRTFSEADMLEAVNDRNYWLWCQDVTSYITASGAGTDNYFMLTMDHDDTTEDGSGTFSHPSDPTTTVHYEGLNATTFRGGLCYIHSYVDDVADI
jgi:hypothetical protein